MSKNESLSSFLTKKRSEITPEMAGVLTHGPRRVPGLRREEVAFLAGVSVDWYVRLEQGRPVTPSEQVLHSIARILRLNEAETEYLVNLARPAGSRAAGEDRPLVRPGVVRMIANLDHQAAFVLGPRMEVLAGNELAWALLTDFPARPVQDRNLLRWLITAPEARELYLDWDDIASDMVGVLQLESSANPRDERIRDLVGELATTSQEFRTRWALPRPEGRTSGTKHFNHPVVGRLTIDWEAFVLPDDASQTLFMYTAADAESAQAMRLLGTWRASLTATPTDAASPSDPATSRPA